MKIATWLKSIKCFQMPTRFGPHPSSKGKGWYISWRIWTREAPDSRTPTQKSKAVKLLMHDHEQYEWWDTSTSFCYPSREETYTSNLIPTQMPRRKSWDRWWRALFWRRVASLEQTLTDLYMEVSNGKYGHPAWLS